MIRACLFALQLSSAVVLSSCTQPVEPTVFSITPAGGVVTFASGAVALIFPANAVSESMTFTATQVVSPPGETVVPGTVFDILPAVTFLRPVQLVVTYAGGALPAGVRDSELGIYRLTGALWAEEAGSLVSPQSVSVSAPITATGTLGILGAPVTTMDVLPLTASVAVGATQALTAIPRDVDGGALPNRAVTWNSLTPAVASVSASGLVSALTVGSSSVVASAGGINGSSSITVPSGSPPPQPTLLASADFETGSLSGTGFTNPWGSGLDFPTDPTGSGKGRIARLSYSPSSGGSMERAIVHVGPDMRYNQTLWMRGYVYFPSGPAPYNNAHNRKILDYQGRCARVTPHRVGSTGEMKVSIVDCMNGSEQEVMDPSTGIFLASDTWHLIEMRITTNSAENVRDGVLEFYMNGSATPTYRLATGLGWITERGSGPSLFNTYIVGFQLTINSGDPVYQEYRYWDKVAFANSRIGGQ